MAIYELMLAEAPSDARLLELITAFFEAEPGAARILGEIVGADEGQVAEAIIVDRSELSGEFALSLTLSTRLKTTNDALARQFADAMSARVLCESPDKPRRYNLYDGTGDPAVVRLADGEDPRDVRVAKIESG
ncbi:MAG: hypothetical protein MI723_05445 [Caulobacterales bacterium]|nr:hypothetical protein [Caulobacterales bacterium]